MDRLLALAEHGQSYWLDNLTRRMIREGELEERVRNRGLRGVTSNPAIFNKAITGGDEYDDQIRDLAVAGAAPEEVYEAVVATDVREACDVLRPVFDQTEGLDGYVSLEVSPHLIHDTSGSVEEARRLWETVDRPNLLIKIPGTPAGVPAIEQLLFEAINVNVTLLFSVRAYEEVARAYVRALEHRLAEGLNVDSIASVASFFLSRIDTLVDRLLSHRVSGRDGEQARRLFGRAAIASARLAYQSYLRLVRDERWARLSEAGARAQRLLWASTSTKNPLYGPVKYVEPLIGPNTVNTMPEVTIEAFARQGQIRSGAIEEGVEEARAAFEDLASLGIDREAVAQQLLHEGAEKFQQPFDALMASIAERRREVLAGAAGRDRLSREPEGLRRVLEALHERRFVRRLYAADPSLWSEDRAQQESIANRLGWTRRAESGEGGIEDLRRCAEELRQEGFRHAIVLGMGGSSLCARVVADTFRGRTGGGLELEVLDQTDPEAIRNLAERVDLRSTLFLVASKSGTTVETLALSRHFFELLAARGVEAPGRQFVALTDAETPLAEAAAANGYRRVIRTPADVGGRYSALTPYGLFPMALVGVDLRAVLAAARVARRDASPEVPEWAIPAIRLGAALGAFARAGRDKLTVTATSSLASFPLWIEQLVAESTGKDGEGIIPIVGEPAWGASRYGDDRLFVHLRLAEDAPGPAEDRLAALEQAGHPVSVIEITDGTSLAGEFLRWEIATATAGAFLGVNPFDEPDVALSKRLTVELLAGSREDVPAALREEVTVSEDGLEARLPGRAEWAGGLGGASPGALLRSFLDLARAGEYVGVLGFFAETGDRDALIAELRSAIRERTGVATTFGYGPRYLHSTGQLHKGGPPSGLYLLLTTDPPEDLPIPGEEHGFSALLRAQALGDYAALADRGRRVLALNLGWYVDEGLRRLVTVLSGV